ncbi:MAG: 30S ribosomal protein S6 [Simkaniaceae bacterium]|nr:30S ribosomal protein S6 [Simkaniaceae bacterium]
MAIKEKKHLYEGMYIISATLSEDARQKALDRIVSDIAEKNGEVVKIHDMGRKKFAYSINGRREGYYYLIYFEAPTQVIDELWHQYHLNEDLIRFVHVRANAVMETLEFKPLEQV